MVGLIFWRTELTGDRPSKKHKSPSKKHKSFDEQIQHLKRKGLEVSNSDSATACLQRINYYHLRGYYIDLTVRDPDSQISRFLPGTTFEQIVARHETDCLLRQALLPYLRKVELAARSACSYALTEHYGSLGYKNSENFSNNNYHKWFLGQVRSATKRFKKEPFVKNYEEHYEGNFPLWVVVEMLPFGVISKLYKNMLPKDQKTAARLLGYQYNRLEQLLNALVVLRNTIAHHSRLHSRRMNTQYSMPPESVALVSELDPGFILQPSSVFSTILGLSRLLLPEERTRLVSDIAAATRSNRDYRLVKLGFPSHWPEVLRSE